MLMVHHEVNEVEMMTLSLQSSRKQHAAPGVGHHTSHNHDDETSMIVNGTGKGGLEVSLCNDEWIGNKQGSKKGDRKMTL